MASRNSVGRRSTARITVCLDLLPHQFALRGVVVAQPDAGIELLGVGDVDVVGRRAAVVRDKVVLRGVHCDPVEPGVELRIAAEVPDRAIRADERVLGDILDFAPVVDVTRDQRLHPMLVLAHQQVEGDAVATLHPGDERLVQFL